MFGLKKKVGVEIAPPAADPMIEAQPRPERGTAARPGRGRRAGAAPGGAGDGRIHRPRRAAQVRRGTSTSSTTSPRDARRRRRAGSARSHPRRPVAGRRAASIAIVLGIIAFVAAFNLPSAGLTLIGAALIAGGVALIVMSRWMEAVTLPGAMIRAMLSAYRRTLEKTMAQARSMDQVVAEAGLTWLETPDQAVVWATALGLEDKIEDVLVAEPRRREGRPGRGRVDLHATLVRVGFVRRWHRRGRRTLLELRGAGLRRHDVRPRDDRELAVIIRLRVRWRVQRWIVGRRRRRVRRRVLGGKLTEGGD